MRQLHPLKGRAILKKGVFWRGGDKQDPEAVATYPK